MQYNKETSVGYALTTTLNLLRKNFNREIKEFGLSSEQYGVLKLVFDLKKLTPTQISELLNRDKATITRIIKSLEGKKLIKKENINNRSFYIKLTRNGEKMLKKADEIAIKYHKMIMENVGEKNIKQMLETLSKIREIF
ncbi:MarR family winged helix-turn-helix transcriptional regulator [Nautilia sp.]